MNEQEQKRIKELEAQVSNLHFLLHKMALTASGLANWGIRHIEAEGEAQAKDSAGMFMLNWTDWQRWKHYATPRTTIQDEVYPSGHYHGD
jgi:hypothetical protein